jgi:hypothetical protein
MGDYRPGIGLDVGTSFLISARMKTDGQVEFKSERDAFFVVKPLGKANSKLLEKTLRDQGTFTLKEDGNFFIVGKDALAMANMRQKSVERPLKRGVISDNEVSSFGMLSKLIESLIGTAAEVGELAVYTYPADPVDYDMDIIYHKNRMFEILDGLGYRPMPILEGEALAYSELANDDYSGIAISCGAGMFNLSVFSTTENMLSFSISQGGDYIDKMVSKQMKIPETAVQAEKESDIDLLNPEDKLQRAIVIYYDALINHVVNALETKFSDISDFRRFGKKIPIVIAGGTCMPLGFLEKISAALLSRSWPFEIGDIRRAKNPLTAVANGTLIYAQMELGED